LIQAIDIGMRPNREGSIERPEIAAGARTYHLFSAGAVSPVVLVGTLPKS
jgi:hypothetical protein